MKIRHWKFVVLFAFALFGGCIPSIHPLYTEDKLVFPTELLGTFVADGSLEIVQGRQGHPGVPLDTVWFQPRGDKFPEIWHFERWDENTFHLVYQDGQGRCASFETHVVELDGKLFLDFFPTDPESEEKELLFFPGQDPGLNDFLVFHLLPVHTFARLDWKGDTLRIHLFDYDYITDLLREKRVRIRHENQDGQYILTAPPRELQKFVEKYADDERLFSSEIVLHRVAP
ncbi:MAG: hypothetical protein D6765_00910 [Bacteroidetes bacterium]|nr:MAG: hypothetical protein D6765_00910 [Bacteroidota bacterium]